MNDLCLPLLIVYAIIHLFTVKKMRIDNNADRIFLWATLTFLSALMTVIVLSSLGAPSIFD